MVNDISILSGIVLVFILLGGLLPYVNAEFETTGTQANVDGLSANVGQEVSGASAVSAFDVLFSIFTMFFWTFGALPFWLDLFFIVIRIIFAVTLARNIWIGGGG
jgi:ABC-type glucose/galactose transport system permease subunit